MKIAIAGAPSKAACDFSETGTQLAQLPSGYVKIAIENGDL